MIRSGDHLAGLELFGPTTGNEPCHDVTIEGCVVRDADWVGAELPGVRMTDVELHQCRLTGANLEEGRLRRVAVRDCQLGSVVATEASMVDVRFDGCQMREAWFRQSGFDRVLFARCDLGRADFYASRFEHSALLRCDLSEAQFSSARLTAVDLHGSTIDDIHGVDALTDVVIGPDQVVPLALLVFSTRNIRIESSPVFDEAE